MQLARTSYFRTGGPEIHAEDMALHHARLTKKAWDLHQEKPKSDTRALVLAATLVFSVAIPILLKWSGAAIVVSFTIATSLTFLNLIYSQHIEEELKNEISTVKNIYLEVSEYFITDTEYEHEDKFTWATTLLNAQPGPIELRVPCNCQPVNPNEPWHNLWNDLVSACDEYLQRKQNPNPQRDDSQSLPELP